MKYFYTIFLILLCATIGNSQNTTWRKIINPGTGIFDRIQPVKNGGLIRGNLSKKALYISTDKGKFWRPLNGPDSLLSGSYNSILRTIRYGSKDSIIFIEGHDNASNLRAFLSKDLGHSWKEVAPSPNGFSLAPFLVHKGKIFTYDYFALAYDETNNKWDTLPLQGSVRLFEKGNQLWAHNPGTNPEAKVYKSVDAGQTWTPTISCGESRVLVQGDTALTLYRRTIDGGANWTDLPFGGNITDLYEDGEFQYLIHNYYTFRSSNFFQTYDTLFREPIHNPIRIDNKCILVSGETGCFRSEDNGQTWERRTDGIETIRVFLLTKVDDFLVAHSPNLGILSFSADNGNSWTGSINPRAVNYLTKINNIYYGSVGSTIYYSNSAISQWKTAAVLEPSEYSNIQLTARNDTLIVMARHMPTNSGRIWLAKSQSNGLVLHAITTDMPYLPQIHVMHQNALYITNDITIWKSTNLGQSWQSVNSPAFGGGLFADGGKLYYIGSPGIRFSTNGGNSWQSISFPSNMQGSIQKIELANNSIYILDAQSQLFLLGPNSSTWNLVDGLPNSQSIINVKIIGDYLFVSDWDGNIWTNAPLITPIHEPQRENKLLIAPNPALSSISIKLPTEIASTGILRIFDSTGKLVTTQPTKDGYSLIFYIANWASGIYFATIETPDGVWTGKFLKPKNE